MTYLQPNPNGSATSANSSPVVIASDQATVPVSLASVPSHAVTNAGTFAVQAAEADGANVTLGAKADAKNAATDTTAVSAMSVLKQISASVQAPPSQAVTNTGTFATQATLAAETTKVIGTVNVAAGQSITANAGTNLNTSALALDATLTGGTAQTKLVKAVIPTATTMQNAATGNANGTSLDVQGYATAVLNITASVAMSGGTTINFEASVDDTTWVAIYGDPTGALTSPAITTTTTGDWSFSVSGYKSMRARISAYSAGTITVKGYATVTTDTPIAVLSNLALNGTAVDGNSGTKSNGTLRVVLATDQPALTNKLLVTPDALPANQSVNVSQINGVTPLMGSGIMGTGSPRVTIASDNDALTVKQGTAANLKVEATIASAQTLGTVSTVTSLTQMNGAAIAMGTGARSAGTQRVTIATDDVVPASQSGTWTVQPGNTANTTPWLVQDTPATAGGLTYTTNSIKATATSLKASAGQVYGWYIFNSNTSAVYVQFFNTLSGSVTLGTTPPVYTLGIPAGGAANAFIPHGILHTTAIVIAATTTATGLTAPANNVDINVFIK